MTCGIHSQALSILNPFPHFTIGFSGATPKPKECVVGVLTVFNRPIGQDSGLRLKFPIPVSDSNVKSGIGINLISNDHGLKELVISKSDWGRDIQVKEIFNGVSFPTGVVLPNSPSFLKKGFVDPKEIIGEYVMNYYVYELRFRYGIPSDFDRVLPRHGIIFDNICGYFPLENIFKYGRLFTLHGNIRYKNLNIDSSECAAFFKGVRQVEQARNVIIKDLGIPSLEVEASVNMVVISACLGKPSLMCNKGSLLEKSLVFTQGEDCISISNKSENERNMVKFSVISWDKLFKNAHSTISPEQEIIRTMQYNYAVVSNNGSVILRFHWSALIWNISVHEELFRITSLLTKCIWDNC